MRHFPRVDEFQWRTTVQEGQELIVARAIRPVLVTRPVFRLTLGASEHIKANATIYHSFSVFPMISACGVSIFFLAAFEGVCTACTTRTSSTYCTCAVFLVFWVRRNIGSCLCANTKVSTNVSVNWGWGHFDRFLYRLIQASC